MSATTRFITPVLLIVVGIAVACDPKVPLGANSDDSDAGRGSDGSVDAAVIVPVVCDGGCGPLPDEYQVRDCGIRPSTASQGQTGIVLSCIVDNVTDPPGSGKDIQSLSYVFTVDGQPASLPGFSFSPDPANVDSLGREQNVVFRFSVSVDLTTEPREYEIAILVEAFAPPHGGSAPERLRYDPPQLPSVRLVVQRRAVLAITETSGPAAVPPGEVGRYCLVVRNEGEAPAANMMVGGVISYLDRAEVPPGVTLEPDPNVPQPKLIAGGESAEFCFLLAVASTGAPTESIRIEWSATGQDGNDANLVIEKVKAQTIVSVGQ